MHFTYQQVKESLRKAVITNGADYVFDEDMSCQYFEQGEPACIVGHVFADAGVSEADLGAYNATDVDTARSAIGATMEPEASVALTIAQIFQDEGASWGSAVDAAVTAAETHGGDADVYEWVHKYHANRT